MKILYKITFAFLFFLSINSCESYLGDDINTDPNRPISVPISAQIPSIQINLADVYGGQFSRFNCLLVQQVEGVARQCSSNNRYSGLLPDQFRTVWSNIYENVLNEIKIAQTKATENGFNHYLGMLNVMEAYTLMIATDVWDDIPYSEAFQGADNLNPKYDTQAQIYQKIYSLLDEGLILLDQSAGGLAIGNDDVFYQGDIENWKKTAHAIKARGLLRDKKYVEAAEQAKLSFTSPDDNFGFEYPDANAAAPWYRFNRDRTGDLEFHPQMRNLMISLNDTSRVKIFGDIFRTTHPYLKANFHQELISYREMQFIIAEADVRNNSGGTAEGYTAYLNGIKAGFEEVGLSAETDPDYDIYIGQKNIAPDAGNLTLGKVMTQKYIALFACPEVYFDWLRTGVPNLNPTRGNLIPVRWEYSSDEYSFNDNAPNPGTINIFTDKVGWNR